MYRGTGVKARTRTCDVPARHEADVDVLNYPTEPLKLFIVNFNTKITRYVLQCFHEYYFPSELQQYDDCKLKANESIRVGIILERCSDGDIKHG